MKLLAALYASLILAAVPGGAAGALPGNGTSFNGLPSNGTPINGLPGNGTPINGGGVPGNGAGAPLNGAGAPVNGTGVPLNGAGAPVNGTGVPLNGAGAPVNGKPGSGGGCPAQSVDIGGTCLPNGCNVGGATDAGTAASFGLTALALVPILRRRRPAGPSNPSAPS